MKLFLKNRCGDLDRQQTHKAEEFFLVSGFFSGVFSAAVEEKWTLISKSERENSKTSNATVKQTEATCPIINITPTNENTTVLDRTGRLE